MTPLNALGTVRAQLAHGTAAAGPLGLDEYQAFAGRTDKIPEHESSLLLLGLFGEAGGLLSALKKKQKDQHTFRSYADVALEELGDVLWYFAGAARRAGLRLSDISSAAGYKGAGTFQALQRQETLFSEPVGGAKVEHRLLTLAARTGRLNEHWRPEGLLAGDAVSADLAVIFKALVEAADDAQIRLEDAALANLQKVLDRFPVQEEWGELYDEAFDEDERLPRELTIRFKEKKTGKGAPYVIQQWNGVNIGDRLTDNSAARDAYRYHDVFHLSYAAHLGWSPVLRALLRVKRKSDSVIDEQQDGARAVITEEGISNWIFSHGLRHHAFEHTRSLDFELLQAVREMVRGYEVESRPLWMWERAILTGFQVFRELRAHCGGTVSADLNRRSLSYSPPG